MRRLFPTERLGGADYLLGACFLAACFLLFFHPDIYGAGFDSLNYLFGDFMEFYENCKKIRGGGQHMLYTPYPPPVYMVFAVWLYPFKLLGAITGPEALPFFLTYWLKALTTIVYFLSGGVFFKIAKEYRLSDVAAGFAAACWLTMPLALYTQFIFSQYDIFYVILMLYGYLMFLRDRPFAASLFFAVAITFKYFPAFAFVPLLLLYEKRLARIAACCAIFIAPMLFFNILYGGSPAFIEGVRGHHSIERIFAASLSIGTLKIYILFVAFAVLCGLAYFAEIAGERRARVAAYVWLVASVLPFIFVVWHPQWTIFFAPAIVLTSILARQTGKLLLLDLAGMVSFVAVTSLVFPGNVDAAMFRGAAFGFDFQNSYLMAGLFNRFGAHSANVFFSAFAGYLVLQIVLKLPLLRAASGAYETAVNYDYVRRSLYVGLLIFLVPAFYAIHRDAARAESLIANQAAGTNFGELVGGRRFEQTFVATGRAVTRVSLLLATYGRKNSVDVVLEIVGPDGTVLATQTKNGADISDNAWAQFSFQPVAVVNGTRYTIRLTSPSGAPGNAVTWWASAGDSYAAGEASVDGIAQQPDFGFMVAFVR